MKFIDWRAELAKWIKEHGYAGVFGSPRVGKTDAASIVLWPPDTSGTPVATEWMKKAERERELLDHVDRSIAKWKANR